jgi:glycosyltransferase 2 family protein
VDDQGRSGAAQEHPQRPRRRAGLGVLLRLLGPVLLVILLWRMRDRDAVLAAITSASAVPLLAAIALNALVIHLKVARWRVMLAVQGIRYGWKRAYAAFLAALYFGMVTPGHVGDALRIQYLKHDEAVGYAEGLATVVMDRLCDLYVLAAIATVGIARYSSVLGHKLALLTWLGVAVAVLGPLALLVPGLGDRLVGWVYRRMRKGKGDRPESYERFVGALRAQLGWALGWTLPLTVAAFGCNYVQGWLLGQALHLALPWFDVVCLLSIASLLALLPISISGVGVRETLFMVVFPLLGYAAASGVSFGLLVFGTIYLVNIVVGAIAWQLAPPPAEPRHEEPVR